MSDKIVIYGNGKSAILLAKKILKFNKNSLVTILNPIASYNINFDFLDFEEKTITRQNLLHFGVFAVIENATIIEINDLKKIINYKLSNDNDLNQIHSIDFDYFIYADNPYRLVGDEKVSTNLVKNIFYAPNPSDAELIFNKKDFLEHSEPYVIFGNNYLSLQLAIFLGRNHKKVYLVSQSPHFFWNIWDEQTVSQLMNECFQLGIKIITNVIDYQYSYNKQLQIVEEITFKFQDQKLLVLKLGTILHASGKIFSDLSFLSKLADFDKSYLYEYGITRIITDNLQLLKPNYYAIGFSSIERSKLSLESRTNNSIWRDYQKFIDYKTEFDVEKMLWILRKKNIEHFPKFLNINLDLSTQINEFFFKVNNFQYFQIGDGLLNLMSRKFDQITIGDQIFDDKEQVIFSLNLNIDKFNLVLKGACLKIIGEGKNSKDHFNIAYSILLLAKYAIINKMTINTLINVKPLIQINPSLTRIWNKICDELVEITS